MPLSQASAAVARAALEPSRPVSGAHPVHGPPPPPISRAPAVPAPPARGAALSFVMIIVAVAIGVFIAGLGLLFVLSRRH
jgi:hypothetical protein